MTDHGHNPTDIAEAAEILKARTAQLNGVPIIELLVQLAVITAQLASRNGPRSVAQDLRELADRYDRYGPRAH